MTKKRLWNGRTRTKSTRRGEHARFSSMSITNSKKRYSNANPGRMGFESAANVADKNEIESDELKNYRDGLSDATRADK